MDQRLRTRESEINTLRDRQHISADLIYSPASSSAPSLSDAAFNTSRPPIEFPASPTPLVTRSRPVLDQLPTSDSDMILARRLAEARTWVPAEEDSESYGSEKVRLLQASFGTDRSAAALVRDVFDGLPGTFRAMLRVWPSDSSLDHLYSEMREWEPIWRQVFPHFRRQTSSVSAPHPVISIQTAVSSPGSAIEETDDAGPARPPSNAVLTHPGTTRADTKTVALKVTAPQSTSVSASVLTSSSADALTAAASTSTTSYPTSTSVGSTAILSAPSSATAQKPATSSCVPSEDDLLEARTMRSATIAALPPEHTSVSTSVLYKAATSPLLSPQSLPLTNIAPTHTTPPSTTPSPLVPTETDDHARQLLPLEDNISAVDTCTGAINTNTEPIGSDINSPEVTSVLTSGPTSGLGAPNDQVPGEVVTTSSTLERSRCSLDSAFIAIQRMRSAWMKARRDAQYVQKTRSLDIALCRLRVASEQLRNKSMSNSAALPPSPLQSHHSAACPHPASTVRESLPRTPTFSRSTALASSEVQGRSFTTRPVLLPAIPLQSPPAYFFAPLHALHHIIITIAFQIINSSHAYINNYQPQLLSPSLAPLCSALPPLHFR
ncbi:hypothetical protein A4X06_0g4997 [Tilletia controversa]|uniref:Uncharacterized protein n=1 Tax=Tilletia controversa TaxID=13291 RepID=A0A8X7MSC3_9BASI|nr:hypothetical protein CF328_g5522 [Tilletia controversa]KAE8246487.1 hypothetical protein A4X06_0g4997 [Tilletia controversa]